ncbi:unnamed protein product [Pedinophyceae sp. YPF-701]|nr:unnamed protein product [Pedinophyceae sp. YPF-701]
MAPKGKGDAGKVTQKSPAEFFAENRNIAGFDNPGKSLYTSVRELVENSLDAAESISTLPDIQVTIEEISQKTLNTMRGISNANRKDEELYHDFETEADRKKRAAKEAREEAKIKKVEEEKGQQAADKMRKTLERQRERAGARGAKIFYRVTVRDNGMGMPHKDIPDMLGRVLSGTKYGVRQTRGKFGLGAKMALIWAKMSTGLPIKIASATSRSGRVSHYELGIDIHANLPDVFKEATLPNDEGWRGSELSVVIEGNWPYYRAKLLSYFRQIAVITPYAQFSLRYVAEENEKASFHAVFERRADKMPRSPKEVRYHPAAVDLELLKHSVATTREPTLLRFLTREFDCVKKDLAERLACEVGMGVEPESDPTELSTKQVMRLHQLLHQARFPDPKGAHLSPAGEYNLRLGIMKELRPEMVATHEGPARAYEGHAFIVEAGVSIGGRDVKPGINVYRFANRIPLLFEAGSDVVTQTATKRINWGAYKINHHTDRVGVFVSIVSSRIPFKGAGKEYMADDIDVIRQAVKAAIQQCCQQLKAKISRQQAAREQKQRKRNLSKYIPDAARAIAGVLETMAYEERAPGPKRRRLQDEQDLLPLVESGQVGEDALVRALREHVERIDMQGQLEFQVQQGLSQGLVRDLYLVPLGARHQHGEELHANSCVFKPLA